MLCACGDGQSAADATPPAVAAAPALPPTANPSRELLATALSFDLHARTASAVITLAASDAPGATLEIGDTDILSVQQGSSTLPWLDTGDRLLLGLPASTQSATITVHYRYKDHSAFDGANPLGYSFTWPYHCGNLFPCRSSPADGVSFTLVVNNPPAGQRVIAPTNLPDAPAYQLAWAVGDYTDLDLGRTRAGTQIVASYRPGERARMAAGTTHLLAVFDWLETTLGPYRFGPVAGPASVPWGEGAFGGIEHHPRWHIGQASLDDGDTQVHEAVHGWFGNGVRMACWEDFVLSEGTATYLAARALDVVAPEAGARQWASYASQLAGLGGAQPVWPAGCNQIDIVKSGLYTKAPYIRGAYFFRALALKLGAPAVDKVLARFYSAHAGRAASMAQLLAQVQQDTGYDPTACAATWLRTTRIPEVGPCL